MTILLIDHDDSFTHNLAQQMGALGADVTVVSHDKVTFKAIEDMKPGKIVLSPGPGSPAEYTTTLAVIRHFHKTIPMLGVCLGHQCLAAVFGRQRSVIPAPKVMHGKTSVVFHKGAGLMKAIPSPFTVARYHSLLVSRVPADFELMCWTGYQKKPDLIMGMYHKTLPVFGVQFHPESFLTEHGDTLMRNFLSLA